MSHKVRLKELVFEGERHTHMDASSLPRLWNTSH